MEHSLFPLPGDGRFYCGPSAIASFTGLHPKNDLRAIINECRGFRQSQGVIGMSNELVEKVLNTLKVKISGFYDVERRPTLRQFALSNPGNFIVNVRSHYVALSNAWAQDNKSGAPYCVEYFSGNKAKVLRVCNVYL
jgi:hypothetical protein